MTAPTGRRLYLATLDALSPGEHVAQAAHALAELTIADPDAVRYWHEDTNTVVCITLDALTLGALAALAQVEELTAATFCEPDRGGELTAVAVLWPVVYPTPGVARILKRARLTGAPGVPAPDAARRGNSL